MLGTGQGGVIKHLMALLTSGNQVSHLAFSISAPSPPPTHTLYTPPPPPPPHPPLLPLPPHSHSSFPGRIGSSSLPAALSHARSLSFPALRYLFICVLLLKHLVTLPPAPPLPSPTPPPPLIRSCSSHPFITLPHDAPIQEMTISLVVNRPMSVSFRLRRSLSAPLAPSRTSAAASWALHARWARPVEGGLPRG